MSRYRDDDEHEGQAEHIKLSPSQIVPALEACLEAEEPCIVMGDPGIGKTALIRQAAARMYGSEKDVQREMEGVKEMRDHEYIRTVILSQREPVDMLGVPVPNKQTRQVEWFTPDVLKFDEDARMVFHMDEFMQAVPILQAPARQLLTEKRFGPHPVPKGVAIVASSNYPHNRAGANRLLTHVGSSIIHLHMRPDLEDFCHIATSRGIRPEIVAFVRFRDELLHKFSTKTDTFPCPRTWEMASHILDTDPPASVEHALYAGTVGEGAAIELTAFLRVYKGLPDIDYVIANPTKAKVPQMDDAGTLYALATALARRATVKNFPSIVQYAKRMPTEFQVFLVRDSIRNTNGQVATEQPAAKAYRDWALENQHVMG